MFTHSVFSVFDSKALVWSPPFIARNGAEACRMFESWSNDQSMPLFKYPEDYSLFEIGSWNENEGEILGNVPKNLGLASNFKKRNLEVV